jgi:hypothetical protein
MDLSFYINGDEVICPEAYAGVDATICPDDDYTLADAWAANYIGFHWATFGDGSFDDPNILHPVYTPGPGDKLNGNVNLCLFADPIPPCPNPATSCMVLTILEEQGYSFMGGWCGLSSYLDPFDPDISNMFADLINANKLVILYNPVLGMYWPGGPVFSLTTWNSQYGYILKTIGDANFEICGEEVSNKTVNITANQWEIIPVLGNSGESVASLFSAFGNQCVVKSIGDWGVYWPQFSINTIGNLKPGKAYFAYSLMDGSITYTTKGENMSSIEMPEFENITPWNDVHYSPITHVVAFTKDVVSSFETGDVIGAFTSEGVCAAMVEYTGSETALSISGDDIYTNQVDGFVNDGYINYRLCRPSTAKMFDMEVVYDPNFDNSGQFHENSMSAVIGMKLSAVGIAEPVDADVYIYPNPTGGTFTIEGLVSVAEVEIFTSYGKAVFTAEMYDKEVIDLRALPKGVYLVRIWGEQGVHYEKLILK